MSQHILNALPEAWCSWTDGDDCVNISQTFRTLFHIDRDYLFTMKDLWRIFGDSPYSTFQRAIQHILTIGGDFTLQASTSDGNIHVEACGRCIEFTHTTLHSSTLPQTKETQLIVLSFRDMSAHISQQDEKERDHLKKDKELETLRLLIDIAPIALWARDTNGRIQYCNLAYAGALETNVHRVIAENKELIDQYSDISTYDLSRRALETHEKQTVRAHIVIAGQRRYLEFSEIPVPETHSTVGYAIDLTELEEIENELNHVILGHNEVFNLLSAPLVIYGPDTHVRFYNSAYRTLFEFDENWLSNNPTMGELFENLRERRKFPEFPNFQEYKNKRISLFNTLMEPIHEIVHQPDGLILRLVTAPTPDGGLIYLFDDITDKISLERRYNTLMAVQKETLDHLFEGLIVFGTDYRIRLSNPAIERLWGITADDRVDGTHINEILKIVSRQFRDSRQSKAWRAKMMDTISKRHPERERLRLKKDKVLEYSYVPLPDGSHLLSFVDISDSWRFEKALQERNQALEREDRLKSDFISHVSYELRSPLNTIAGFSEILLNQYFGTLNEKQLDYCKGINESTDRLMNLINDMLDLASIEAGKLNLHFQDVHISSFLTSVSGLVQNRANDHGLDLHIDNLIGDQAITIDIRRMKHALFNLLTNAIKFTPSGGQIRLIAEKSTHAHNSLDFIVEDNGIGISEEDQERIFRIFQQSLLHQNQQNGAGLGLTLVKNLIELHGGHIHLDSEVGKGTRVVCSLPLVEPKKKSSSKKSHAEAAIRA